MNVWLLIVNGVFSLLKSLIGLLPDIDSATNTAISNWLVSFKGYVAPLNYVFPVATFFSVLGMILTIEAIVLAYKLTLWIGAHLTAGFIKES